MAEAKGLRWRAEIPPDLPPVWDDRTRLRQVTLNLVNNAVNYAPSGVVTIKVIDGEDNIQVEVMDNGIGIPPEDLPRVFDDFFRASNVETKGTGLGLSISKRIVEAHGGTIRVESPCPGTNAGSKFTFTLPKKREVERG